MKYAAAEHTFYYSSPLGTLTLTSDGACLTGLSLGGRERLQGEKSPQKILPVFEQTVRWLDIYFSGKAPDFTPPLKWQTTPFRRRVWKIMLKIPYGQTVTYGEIAAQIAQEQGLKKMSAQAVGGAVGHNAIAIIIPCHRVIGADGSLTGYGSGISKKIQLLKLEKIL